jgi:ketosteroid isomerase-like protein
MTQISVHETEQAVARVIALFEHLSPADLPNLGQYYAPHADFKDPFNEVRGLPEIQRIFAHMFEALHEPRFVITARVVQGQQCFLTWEFLFRFKGFQQNTPQTVRGATHLLLNGQGLITLHRDYWDAAEEMYEKFPLVGSLMRWLKKRANS